MESIDKSLVARAGARYTMATQRLADKIEPALPSAGYKGRRKVPKQGALRKLQARTATTVRSAPTRVRVGGGSPLGQMAGGLVYKSYVPGKGWVKATEVGAKVLREAKHTRPKEARMRKLEAKRASEHHREVSRVRRDLISNSTAVPAPGRALHHHPTGEGAEMMRQSNFEAFALRQGGRSSGTSHVFYPKGAPQGTINHELGHARPRRSSYRMQTIIEDPVKLMREEGRAEMSSGVKGAYYRNRSNPLEKHQTAYTQISRSELLRRQQEALGSPYASKAQVKAFRETQDKIANARRAKGRAAHDITGQRAQPSWVQTHVRDKPVRAAAVGGGVSVLGAGGVYGQRRFRGNQHVDADKRKRIGKSLDMGNQMASATELDRPRPAVETETLPTPFLDMGIGSTVRSLRLRDTTTGRFVAGPGLLREE